MNRRGVTLVEVLVAGALWVMIISSFSYFLKVAWQRTASTEKLLHALYEARSQMEELRALPTSTESEVIWVEVPPVKLYSLRSKYL